MTRELSVNELRTELSILRRDEETLLRQLAERLPPPRSETGRRIIAAMSSAEITTGKLSARVGVRADYLCFCLRRLVMDGYVIRVSSGVYRLPEREGK